MTNKKQVSIQVQAGDKKENKKLTEIHQHNLPRGIQKKMLSNKWLRLASSKPSVTTKGCNINICLSIKMRSCKKPAQNSGNCYSCKRETNSILTPMDFLQVYSNGLGVPIFLSI